MSKVALEMGSIREGREDVLTATRYQLSGSRLAGNLALTASKSFGCDSGFHSIVE